MNLPTMIGLIGLLYILVFGGVSLLRREGLSARFAIEALIITGITFVIVAVFAIPIHPVIFLLIIYLITQRVSILVDVANSFANRKNYAQAENLYSLASRIGPDTTRRLVVELNRSIMLLQENKLDESIAAFTEIIRQADTGFLGIRYEAGAHFNLGVAYLRKNNPSSAKIEFNAAIDTWPGSIYAHRAQQALNRQHQKESTPVEEKPADR